MTLGELITELEKHNPARPVSDGFGSAGSWRGSYEEIAFRPEANTTVGAMLAHARAALGRTFEGYKGGEYAMTEHTPVNIAEWGEYGGDDDHLCKWRLRAMLAARDEKEDGT